MPQAPWGLDKLEIGFQLENLFNFLLLKKLIFQNFIILINGNKFIN